jgi:hypothetical protein
MRNLVTFILSCSKSLNKEGPGEKKKSEAVTYNFLLHLVIHFVHSTV